MRSWGDDLDDVRKIALLWPEVEDGTSYGTRALKVHMRRTHRLLISC
jgi:hypothetical protein